MGLETERPQSHGTEREIRTARNYQKLAVPKVNPEIWGKLTHYGKKQDLRLSAIQNKLVKEGTVIAQSAQNLMDFRTKGANGGKFDTAVALTSQTDVIALLGHTNYELSLCPREAVKPNLNKEYGSLCSSQTPVTTLLFGDELQAQLTAIRASNRISHTAVSHNSGSSSSSNPSWRQEQDKPFLGKGQYQPKWKQKP
ncbi:unnamed protein product [Porites evermanni]|uniref:Uncharacterized protein n=1 Tax=Porites evermanni TaxID=104178 RepID=A0ABN8RLI3_9CNID|nr:unnamed protein product [Porites evermanni]